MKEASFYEQSENKSVHCKLCPHLCKIAAGNKGVCGVRRNHDGRLIAENYGRVTSMALDPIEKKPLYHFYPGTKILSLGSYGCNFHCGFCQNYHISMQEAPYEELTPEDIAAASKELETEGNIGVAYTYNEPLIGFEFVKDCARLIAAQGQKNILVTNGYVCSEPLERLLPLIDAMNIDLKSFDHMFYKKIGGGLDDVKRIIGIAAKSCHVEVTTLVIPDENDTPEEMERLAVYLAEISEDIVLHISRFFPNYKMKDILPTRVETIYELADVAKRHLNYVYTGNC